MMTKKISIVVYFIILLLNISCNNSDNLKIKSPEDNTSKNSTDIEYQSLNNDKNKPINFSESIFFKENITIDSFQNWFGIADSIQKEEGAFEEFGFDIFDIYYDENIITITDGYLSLVDIRNQKFSILGIQIGDKKETVVSLCKIYRSFKIPDENALLYSIFENRESYVVFYLKKDKVNRIEYLDNSFY